MSRYSSRRLYHQLCVYRIEHGYCLFQHHGRLGTANAPEHEASPKHLDQLLYQLRP